MATVTGDGPSITATGSGSAVTVTITTGGGSSGGSGDVLGPGSSTDGAVALFDGVSGKILKDGVVLGTAAQSATGDFATAAQGALADTATQPADLGTSAPLDVGTTAGTVAAGDDARLTDDRDPNAHAASHQDGGTDELALDASQTATGTLATARLGSGTADATTFLRGDQTWATPAGGGGGTAAAPPHVMLDDGSAGYSLPGFVADTRKVQAWTGNRRKDYYPVVVQEAITVDQLQCNVSTAGAAGSLLIMGLYEAGAKFQPGTRLEVSGSISAESTGSKTYSFTERTLQPGRYVLALNCNVDTATGPTMLGVSIFAPFLRTDAYASVISFRVPSDTFDMPDPGTAYSTALESTTNGFFAAYCFLRVTGYA